MKFLLMKITMFTSSIILFMNHPMSMGLMLMIQTITIIMFMNKILTTSWFAMITFMMMMGGLLIMFMYMSSIASNEKFKLKLNLILMMIVVLVIQDEMMMQNQINEMQEMNDTKNIELSLTKIYNQKSMMLTILMVLYLLLTMISVTKMVKHHKGPLRTNY
uniref:NADH-ubiquinone oxidoreductase chain 6 n=1 Tax=Eurhadina exclamationis TaxID=2892960 RepID=A0A9E7BVH4_9HEMI|nr:NADH dehydrogenase subunit 6 [Eurhadina exclamationis]UGN61508.1 NADH dehydrogenase subunit 6 [Eurhadina exclamationis]